MSGFMYTTSTFIPKLIHHPKQNRNHFDLVFMLAPRSFLSWITAELPVESLFPFTSFHPSPIYSVALWEEEKAV